MCNAYKSMIICGFGRCGSQGLAWLDDDVAEWIIELDFDQLCDCRVRVYICA